MTNLVRIVLIDPSHPGNIGSVARAMKNMALSDLVLGRTRSFSHAEAHALAGGGGRRRRRRPGARGGAAAAPPRPPPPPRRRFFFWGFPPPGATSPAES